METIAVSEVGRRIATQNFHHGRPSVALVVECGTCPGILGVAQHFAWKVVVQVTLLWTVNLRRCQLLHLHQVRPYHVAQCATLVDGEVRGQIVLCQQYHKGRRSIVGVHPNRIQIINDVLCRLEAVQQVFIRLLLVLDDGTAVDEIVVPDELG